MELLNKYFSKLTFEYIEEKQGYSIYGAALYNLLGGDKVRIVFLFVPANKGALPEKSAKINSIRWQNLQTRTLPKGTYKLRQQDWNFPINLQNIDFQMINRNKSYTLYTSSDPNFNFQISMLHDPKKKTIYQYPNQMNLHWAIDQWNTVFNYVAPVDIVGTYSNAYGIETFIDGPQEIKPPSVTNPLETWVTGTTNYQQQVFELI